MLLGLAVLAGCGGPNGAARPKARQLRSGDKLLCSKKELTEAGIQTLGAFISHRNGILREWIFWVAGCQNGFHRGIQYDKP